MTDAWVPLLGRRGVTVQCGSWEGERGVVVERDDDGMSVGVRLDRHADLNLVVWLRSWQVREDGGKMRRAA